MSRLLLGLALLCCAAPALAWPTVVEIRFEGNEVTREEVIRRELALGVGDPADPNLLEASRQAIQDLGLFREVELIEEQSGRGVALIVRVREKFYILPIPRLDTSSDRDLSYGLQLRWSNIGGRNHSMNLYVERGDFPEDRLRESERSARISYSAPYVFGTRYRLDTGVERIERRRPPEDGGFDETLDRAQLLVLRDLRTGVPRHGWTVGGGLFHQRQQADGPGAPPDDGRALALVGEADYSDLRFHLYSETGQRFRARAEWAGPGSDYDYQQLQLRYARYLPLGELEHQTLHLLGEGGLRRGGPDSRSAFFLGGSSTLRGYDSDTFAGEDYWLVGVEYLRPLRWRWLRLLAVAELGGAGASLEPDSPRGPHASVGLGLRIRLTWLVNTEIEIGYAWPLRGGGGGRFFAGSN
ncbi:BamA/TamA family outer membrane protein [Pseudomarimonas salicorniae]|uniref:BamA/TamA family outer membrane protein n=1 Tax=Pseudomarimonas salicorniae TaxID=2933270 RepID=A0ABT0GD13_9GAMM|nr:BamA/TamA family outer membrane protein [Lysobacter sp. CAU 1642]MCK7592079.1 BamA/TamA family outer membrane protein [Lysobacter sp. CAU 1642]